MTVTMTHAEWTDKQAAKKKTHATSNKRDNRAPSV